MANLRYLRQKDKTYIFHSFGNSELENPGKINFKRFPMPDEVFPYSQMDALMGSDTMKHFDGSPKSQEKLIAKIMVTLADNHESQRTNFRRFMDVCVESFSDLAFDGREIRTVQEFFDSFPEDAAYLIAYEALAYSKDMDLFTMEEKKSWGPDEGFSDTATVT